VKTKTKVYGTLNRIEMRAATKVKSKNADMTNSTLAISCSTSSLDSDYAFHIKVLNQSLATDY
jgi:hypothetical protein